MTGERRRRSRVQPRRSDTGPTRPADRRPGTRGAARIRLLAVFAAAAVAAAATTTVVTLRPGAVDEVLRAADVRTTARTPDTVAGGGAATADAGVAADRRPDLDEDTDAVPALTGVPYAGAFRDGGSDRGSDASATTPSRTHDIEVVTHPPGARVEITPVDDPDAAVTGTAPLSATVPRGTVELSLALDGHERRTDRVAVYEDRTFDRWLDPAGLLHRKVTEFDTGAAPKQVAFTPDGTEVWVTLLGGPGVEVYRPRTGERLAGIDLGDHGAVEVIFTADGGTAYASQMESASVFEIDTATYEVRRELSTGGTWSKVMALSPDEDTLYVSNWTSNDVSEIDLTSGEVLRTLPTVATPRGLYVPDDDTLYVAGFAGGDLARLDLGDGDDEVLTSTGGAMRHLVADAERDLLYAGDLGADAVFVHELGTDRVARLADTDHKPNTIDLAADGRVLYVSNRGANNPESYYLPGPEWGSVLAFDAATGDPLDAIVGGNQTTGLDVSDDGRLLAFSDFLDDRVQVYEIPPYDVLAAGDGGRYGEHLVDLAK